MIVFDLEWNSGLYDRVRLDEILQIGAVKVARPGGNIIDSFNAYIRPRVHKRLSPAAAVLPDLALSQRSHLDLPTALTAFLDWCGEDRVFASWGGGDLAALLQNQKYWRLPDRLPRTYVDLQAAFDRAVGTSVNLSLEWAAEYCGVPDIFDPHNALVDALYAACVARLLGDGELAEAVREPGPLLKGQKALPRRAQPWKGPFESLERTLNNRGCRRGTCPECGAFRRVSQWHRGEDGLYRGRFTCPQCGLGYILTLEVAQDKTKRFWGNTSVRRATGESKAVWQAAARTPPIPCRGKGHGGRRRKSGQTQRQAAAPTL